MNSPAKSSIERAIEKIVTQLPGYEPRPQQVEMAKLIDRAMTTRRHAIIEAGTGSGKSFGYLIPALEAGKRVVISTGTIALQEQLLHKDLPFLERAYGREIKVALAKGRSNYLCMRRLEETYRTLAPTDLATEQVKELIQLSASKRWEGDRADLPFTLDQRFWMEHLASDGEDCLGPKCPNWMVTPHRIARFALDDAQIIIANHALYFTDLATEAGIIPQHDLVVFDEAQHLDRCAVAAFSQQVNRYLGPKLFQRVQRRFPNIPPSLIQELNDGELGIAELIFERGRGQFRLDPDIRFQSLARTHADTFLKLSGWLEHADASQMEMLADDPALAKQQAETVCEQMRSVAADLAERWSHFADLRPIDDRANWMVSDPNRDFFELQSAPLDVGEFLHTKLWTQRTCVLTSATLAVDGKFEYLRKELGLPTNAMEAVLGSPFDYPNQALLYIPRALPLPSDPSFNTAVLPEIERILKVTEGRAFVLCTSYRSMREISTAFAGRLPYPSKTQEDLPRARLVEWFKSTPNAVLFATATFWEGVDIPGDALSCVIIDKLPFASPDDPVVQARTDRMKARDEDWFGGFMLPKAVLALKQGFGRLIRSRTDRGLVAILDRRILTHRYGEVVLRSLPPARRLYQLPPDLETAFARPVVAASNRTRPERWDDHGWSGRSNAPPPDLDAVLGEPLP